MLGLIARLACETRKRNSLMSCTSIFIYYVLVVGGGGVVVKCVLWDEY